MLVLSGNLISDLGLQSARACWQGLNHYALIGHDTGWTTARSLDEVGCSSVQYSSVMIALFSMKFLRRLRDFFADEMTDAGCKYT